MGWILAITSKVDLPWTKVVDRMVAGSGLDLGPINVLLFKYFKILMLSFINVLLFKCVDFKVLKVKVIYILHETNLFKLKMCLFYLS